MIPVLWQIYVGASTEMLNLFRCPYRNATFLACSISGGNLIIRNDFCNPIIRRARLCVYSSHAERSAIMPADYCLSRPRGNPV
jgi:hypothetical protein